MTRFDDPDYVREQYATEAGLKARVAAYEGSGPDPRDTVLAALRGPDRKRVLEVGCGCGELAERIVRELGCELVAIDQSERMVERARERGVDARVGDVQRLDFGAERFDAAVAAWMLYHVPDVDRALAELARVLRPGGTLVAVTNGVQHLRELWQLIGRQVEMSFRAENGAELLLRHFARVERHDVSGPVTFPDAEAVRAYVGSSAIGRPYLDRVPELDAPLVATKVVAVFVANKAA